MSPATRTSHSPPSHDEDLNGTGLHSRSRNARAQARHRAKRKKYIETLEESVKRLQAIVDAAGLDPNAYPPALPSATQVHHPYALRELQDDNARLRREADALRIQLAALTAHVSNGGHVTSHYSPTVSDAPTPPPNERDPKKRKMSVEREHLYLDHHPGRTSPASASNSSLASSIPPPSSASSLSMLSPLQQQVVYNSLFSGLGSTSASTPSVSTSSSSQPHASRPTSPPVPVSTFAQLPSTSLLATSLYPLLTLGIAGGAVSGELGAAAWNAFQQSQLQQAQAQAQQAHLGQHHSSLGQSSGLGQQNHGLSSLHHQSSGLPGLGSHSFMSQSQPMSTLSSSLDSVSSLPRLDSRLDSGSSSGLPRMDSSGLPRIDSPSGLPQSLESMRTSSPSSFSSPRFEPSSSRFDPVFTETNSPHLVTSTPPGFTSSSSSTPGLSSGAHLPEGRRSSGSSRRDDVP